MYPVTLDQEFLIFPVQHGPTVNPFITGTVVHVDVGQRLV